MESFVEQIGSLIHINAIPAFFGSLILLFLLVLLLGIGRRLEPALRLERIGVPIALLVGFTSLFLGPYGLVPLMPIQIADIWIQLPIPLLTLIFATLMLGRPLPKSKGLWKPVASQASLGLLLGFGQYFVGGLVVLYFLIPSLGVDPLMACLIEVGFEGGHGAAAIMGSTFSNLGFQGGEDLGLAMATVGLLSSTLLGTLLVVIARSRNWVVHSTIDMNFQDSEIEEKLDFLDRSKQLVLNLGFAGCAVSIGYSMLLLLRIPSPFFGGIYQDIFKVLPVFPFALLASLLIRWLLEYTGNTKLVSPILQREIGTLSTDLLIITAMASLNLPLLINDWLPIAVLSVSGLAWNLFAMFFIARFLIKNEWFERSITEFGNATGVAASGLLLLRLSDPRSSTNALPIFSIKQLFLQPLLSGGIVTVLAPLLVTRFGLIGWTEISGLLTISFVLCAYFLQDN